MVEGAEGPQPRLGYEQTQAFITSSRASARETNGLGVEGVISQRAMFDKIRNRMQTMEVPDRRSQLRNRLRDFKRDFKSGASPLCTHPGLTTQCILQQPNLVRPGIEPAGPTMGRLQQAQKEYGYSLARADMEKKRKENQDA